MTPLPLRLLQHVRSGAVTILKRGQSNARGLNCVMPAPHAVRIELLLCVVKDLRAVRLAMKVACAQICDDRDRGCR